MKRILVTILVVTMLVASLPGMTGCSRKSRLKDWYNVSLNVYREGLKTNWANEEEYKSLMNRLSRIEGQVRGIRKMVETDAYCVDILTQVSAIQAALNAFNRELLGNHIKTCVADNIRSGNDEIIDELMQTLQKLMK